ncbi:lipopolysaccharide biosynthesis protein [Methylobacterium sp. E-041]|uniref:lipopolysaccharide biosynthesis protein n=1 Tax=Methylobacterium sp. E-041 TaxID=2836573 RepID=UPI001FBBDDC3|nr:lipopolysaccharide biosynthesis protein [Methylobacterium sp. E-041]MCJ2104444.1 lipopolysaccharide biosynthesis protein [Methylobacterium sp. E-041]
MNIKKIRVNSFDPDNTSDNLKSASIRGVAVTSAGQGVRFFIQFGTQIIMARLLLPSEFGLIAMALPFLSLVQIFNDLGLSRATVQQSTISHESLSYLFWLNVIVSFVLAMLFVASAPFISAVYGEPKLEGIISAFATLLIISGLSAQQAALLERRMKFSQLAVMDVLCLFIGSLVGIFSAILGCGYWSIVYMQAANSIVILIMVWYYSNWIPSFPKKTPGSLKLIIFGGKITGYNLIYYVTNSLPSITIGINSGAIPLGLYDRSYKLIITPLWQVQAPLARVAISLLSRLVVIQAKYTKAFMLLLKATLLLTMPGLLCCATYGTLFVIVVLGEAWVAAGVIVSWLAISFIFFSLRMSAGWLFVSQGRAEEQIYFGLLSAVFTAAALFIGMIWGLTGIIICLAIFSNIDNVVTFLAATSRGPVSSKLCLKECYPILISAILGCAITWVANIGLQEVGAGNTLRLFLNLASCYFFTGVALIVIPSGRRMLVEFWGLWSSKTI